jgi:hypothetical protein
VTQEIVLDQVFGAAEFQAATGATAAQMADLEAFRAALADWNTRMNLVGPSALAEFWLRHAYDSAQLLKLEPEALRWADLGAGAGFPGLVLAIFLKGRPGATVWPSAAGFWKKSSPASRCRPWCTTRAPKTSISASMWSPPAPAPP